MRQFNEACRDYEFVHAMRAQFFCTQHENSQQR
jgi:hypothetical protein